MGPRIIHGQTFADYCDIEAVNQSSLKLLHYESPLHYQQREHRDTAALAFGRAVHTSLLEPAEFPNLYTTSPFSDFRTKEAREWRDRVQANGTTILTEDEITALESITHQVESCKLWRKLSGKANKEVTIIWTDAETGLDLKARLDMMADTEEIVVDLKTCQSAHPKKFQRDAFAYGYHFQAAFYSAAYEAVTGKPPKAFIFLAIEKSKPFCVVPYPVSPLMIEAGRTDMGQALATLRRCIDTNEWPSFSAQTLELPGYAQADYPGVYSQRGTEECPI